jgi:hypothetical protein
MTVDVVTKNMNNTAAITATRKPLATRTGDLTAEMIATSVWSDELVASAGIPIVDAPFVSVGGGMGSFVMVDYLRIAGVPADKIKVLSNLKLPWQTYEYLTRVSQIPQHERIRSDSSGCPDNIWAFPSYALREAWQDQTIAPLMSVLFEPIFTDYWTPKAGQVFASLGREVSRIGYPDMVANGQVRMVRRRKDGGYFTILTPEPGTSPTKRVAYRSWFVHLAVGYPGLQFLPDLREYRRKHDDPVHVVNAYEPHEHVYESLLAAPGTVLVRGGGIVASRVLQRLMEDRMNKGAQTRIHHLFRTYVSGSHGKSITSRRKGSGGFAYSGFNWPKGAWGGQLKETFERLEGDERAALYKQLGGAHTPKRKLWQQQKKRATDEGWYHTYQGVVTGVDPGARRGIVTDVRNDSGQDYALEADFIIDCTGLEGDIREHRVLADLLDHSGAARNPLGRLDVERDFEVRGTANGSGRMFASGSATLGGYYAGVDTFLGLQYSALAIADRLADLGFAPRIGVGRSVSQWWRWVRNRSID